jgi:glutathione S-transferase
MRWCFAAVATIELPLAQMLFLGTPKDKDAAERRKGLVQWTNRVLGNLEQWLHGREWVAAADFTVADILVASVLREIRKTDLLAPYPNTTAYFVRAQARPAWQRTLTLYAERLGVSASEIR